MASRDGYRAAAKRGARKVESNYLTVAPTEAADAFVVLLPGGEPLRTPRGLIVSSPNYRLLLHMVRELEAAPVLTISRGIISAPRPLSAYLLFSTEQETEAGAEGLTFEQTASILDHDPVLHPAAGPERTDQLRAWEHIACFLRELGTELLPISRYARGDEAEATDAPSTTTWASLVVVVMKRSNRLSPAARSVLRNLHHLTAGHTLSALCLASGACTANEFALATLATSPAHYSFGFARPRQHRAFFEEARALAQVCVDYLGFFPSENLELLIAQGEGTLLEFKATLRWDLREQKKNPELTFVCLKAIAAFLNTAGGTLLIGVGDDGEPVGIAKDGFASDDQFLLHLYGAIRTAMGTQVATGIRTRIDGFRGESVCVVSCKPSPIPVRLRGPRGVEEFYVRSGPSSVRLPVEEQERYVHGRFGPAEL